LLTFVVSQTGAVKVAAPDFTFVGLDAQLGAVFQERFVNRLGAPNLHVTTQRDVAQLLGLERQKQLLGCDTAGTQCIAELAGALGVEAVVTGSIARSESGFIVNLRALRSGDAQTLASPNTRVASEAALLDWLDDAADELRGQLLRTLRPEAPAAPLTRWVPGLIGAALFVGGAVCTGISIADYQWLISSTPPALAEIPNVRQRGELLLPTGLSLMGAGVVGLVASLVWNASGPKPVQVGVVPLREGAALSIGGELP